MKNFTILAILLAFDAQAISVAPHFVIPHVAPHVTVPPRATPKPVAPSRPAYRPSTVPMPIVVPHVGTSSDNKKCYDHLDKRVECPK